MTGAALNRTALGLAAVGLGSSLGPLDTAVNIALPAITQAFGLELRSIQWLVICYVLTYSSLMLICGRIGDLFGYRRVFRTGLVISVVGFALCSIAGTWGFFLVARMVQGLGTALVLSCAPALATSLYPESERTRALGIWGSMMAIGAAVGPSLGGVMVDLWGWSSVFWFRAPIALVALLLSPALPPPSRGAAPGRFDAPGAVLLAGAMSILLLVPVTARMPEAVAWWPLLAAVAGAGLLAAYVLRARRVAEPIIRPGLFRDIDFCLHNLASIAVSLASFAVLLLVPYHLVQVTGLPARIGGLVLAISAVGAIAGSALAPQVVRRIGQRPAGFAGIVLCGLGLYGIGLWERDASIPMMAAVLLVQGIGAGLFQIAYTDMVTAKLPPRERGVAGSLATVTRTVGVVSGATLLSGLFTAAEATALAAGMTAAQAFETGFHVAVQWAGLGLLGALALSLLRPSAWLRRVASG